MDDQFLIDIFFSGSGDFQFLVTIPRVVTISACRTQRRMRDVCPVGQFVSHTADCGCNTSEVFKVAASTESL